jgi:hypothetical protein
VTTSKKLQEGGVNPRPTNELLATQPDEFTMRIERGGVHFREDVGTARLKDGRKVEMSRSLNGMTLFVRFQDNDCEDWVVFDLRQVFEKMCDLLKTHTNS